MRERSDPPIAFMSWRSDKPGRYAAPIDGDALAREFMGDPLGRHSVPLQHLLNFMRAGPIEGKLILVMTKPHAEWTLGRLSREHPLTVQLLDHHRYTSLEDAERIAFALRWEELTGRPLREGSA